MISIGVLPLVEDPDHWEKKLQIDGYFGFRSDRRLKRIDAMRVDYVIEEKMRQADTIICQEYAKSVVR